MGERGTSESIAHPFAARANIEVLLNVRDLDLLFR
jgi:hypothetical protein